MSIASSFKFYIVMQLLGLRALIYLNTANLDTEGLEILIYGHSVFPSMI